MKKSNKTIYFITGGGTGGHIYPAVAVADFLNKDDKNKIYYIGNPKNLEYEVVKQKGYDFLGVNVHAMPRKLSFKLFVWVLQLFMAVLQAMYYISVYKPNVVFGTGGYVSAPALIAAKILKVPFVMHDCDTNPGLVTRKLAPWASSVSLAFGSAQVYIKNENCYVNGNPIREKFKTLTKEQARKDLGLADKMTVCIMGGSQGAKSINITAVEILKTLSQNYNTQVIFQTGKKNYDYVKLKLSKIYPEYEKDKNLLVKPYFNDMVTVLKASDIAVSRAGSLSISELCASSVATIFVPYPHAAADHQRKNARVMEENGAGLYIEDSDVTSKRLLNLITDLINNSEKLSLIRQNAQKLARLNATDDIVKQIKDSI